MSSTATEKLTKVLKDVSEVPPRKRQKRRPKIIHWKKPQIELFQSLQLTPPKNYSQLRKLREELQKRKQENGCSMVETTLELQKKSKKKFVFKERSEKLDWSHIGKMIFFVVA